MSISKTIEEARKRARTVQESCHYDGVCTVYIYGKTVDEYGITSLEETVYEDMKDLPCHLSVQTMAASDQTESSDNVSMVTKLFTSPDTVIPAGSKVVVTQEGKTTAYKCSSEPAVYATHQEAVLSLFDGWA